MFPPLLRAQCRRRIASSAQRSSVLIACTRSPKSKRFNSTSTSSEPPRPQRNVIGVFSPLSALIFVSVGCGLYFYFAHEKQKLIEQREKERQASSYGRPNVGGPFALTEAKTGKEFTEKELLGKWSLVYFGFTNCPDICPAELDKVTSVVEEIKKTHPSLPLQPVFISVDPARDTPSQISTYLEDFHPSFIGLVGDYAKTKAACKAYRVYFSTPPDADPKGDYLVDHSIFVYLMDPDGKFVEAFGQATGAEEVVGKVKEAVERWR